MWTPHSSFSLDGTTHFLFIEKYDFLAKYLESSIIFVLFFFKGKQNKKENLKCDSLFEKKKFVKIETNPIIRLLIRKVRRKTITPL